VVPVAVIWFTEGSIASSTGRTPVAPHRIAPPSVVQLRAFLRENGQHPTTCAARGTETVCRLARGGGRCDQDADGSGECTYPGTTTSQRLLTWATSTVSVTVTGSDHR